MNFYRHTSIHLRRLALFSCMLLAAGSQAAIIVPAGASMSLAGGTMDLGCTDITVGGNLQINGAAITNVHDMSIQAGTPPDGVVDGGSGTITLAGSWSNGGTFTPGTSGVSFVDNPGCSPASTLSGNTTFYDLSLVSTVGKIYTVSPASTQGQLHGLTIQGTLLNPIQIVSGAPGNAGFFNLAAGGTQNILHVGVSDNWATGQPLAPLLSNEGGTGNSRGWFGIALITAIPTLGPAGMVLMALMLFGFGIFLTPAGKKIHAVNQRKKTHDTQS
ncbi:hypothetical protein BH11PSE11_BH11PSE11_17870 [soil metagenome]